jgi:hypothetical protein
VFARSRNQSAKVSAYGGFKPAAFDVGFNQQRLAKAVGDQSRCDVVGRDVRSAATERQYSTRRTVIQQRPE